MEYKYYIYRQSLLFPNFNKYDLTNYEYFAEITNNSQWSLNIERNSDWFTVIRHDFNGSISLIGNDFNTLIAIEGDTRQYAIIIHRKCSGSFSEFWKGYFSWFDFKVDLDRCTLSFQPTVWDDYSPIFDQMEIERNVLAAGDFNTVAMRSFEWPTESLTITALGFSVLAPPVYDEHPDGGEYYRYSQASIFLEWTSTGFPLYSGTVIYKREVGYTDSNVTGPPGTYWVWLEETQPNIHKWVRRIGDESITTYTHTVDGMDEFDTLNLPGVTAMPLLGAILLSDVLDYYSDFFDLNYESDFFNDDPCPMGIDTLSLTMIQHISNLRDISDPATKGMMKLKDLLTWIRDTFNAYWYIDSSGDFRIEHRKYFDLGLDYAPAMFPVIELNLSTAYQDEVKNMRRYEWERPNLFRFEKIDLPYSYFDDWINGRIEYLANSILGNNTKTSSVDWGTDLVAMYEARDELATQGWALLDIYDTGGKVYSVRYSTGALTGQSYQNVRFSQANLFRDLWTWGRLIVTGNINGIATTFDSVQRLRQQPQLTIPMCCQDIDFNGIFRTPLGDGWIDKAEYEAKTGNLKLNLIYE